LRSGFATHLGFGATLGDWCNGPSAMFFVLMFGRG
jgi:hypothetical protein